MGAREERGRARASGRIARSCCHAAAAARRRLAAPGNAQPGTAQPAGRAAAHPARKLGHGRRLRRVARVAGWQQRRGSPCRRPIAAAARLGPFSLLAPRRRARAMPRALPGWAANPAAMPPQSVRLAKAPIARAVLHWQRSPCQAAGGAAAALHPRPIAVAIIICQACCRSKGLSTARAGQGAPRR